VEATIERPILADDREVFGELVRPHWDVMTALARRLAAPGHGDDVVQEALAAAWRKRGQFDPDRGTARSCRPRSHRCGSTWTSTVMTPS